MVSRNVMALRPLSIALIAVVALLAAALDCAASPSDSAIVVQGNRRIGADAIRAYFHLQPGAQPDQLALDVLRHVAGRIDMRDVRSEHVVTLEVVIERRVQRTDGFEKVGHAESLSTIRATVGIRQADPDP